MYKLISLCWHVPTDIFLRFMDDMNRPCGSSCSAEDNGLVHLYDLIWLRKGGQSQRSDYHEQIWVAASFLQWEDVLESCGRSS